MSSRESGGGELNLTWAERMASQLDDEVDRVGGQILLEDLIPRFPSALTGGERERNWWYWFRSFRG